MGPSDAPPVVAASSVAVPVQALLDVPEFSWALADALPGIVWTARPEGEVERFNLRWETYTGVSLAGSVGWAWTRAVHPGDLANAMAAWRSALSTGLPYESEYRIRRASDGAWRWHAARAQPRHDASGATVGWVGTVTDIHDRREREAAARSVAIHNESARQQLEAVVQHMVEAVLVLGTDGTLAVANAAALALHGYPDLHAMRADLGGLVGRYETRRPDGTPMDPSAWPATVALRGETVVHLEVHVRDRVTGRQWVGSFSATPLYGSDGTVRQAVVTIHDLTAERGAMQERERLLAELRQAVAARDEFLSVASHELNTPLTPLQLQLDTLLRAAREGTLAVEPARTIERLVLAARQVDRLTTRVASLLDVSRIMSNTLRMDLDDVDLAEVTHEVVARFANDLSVAGSSLTVDIAPSVPGRWDRLRLDQVATNLLSNALKYGSGRPVSVTVTAGPPARLVVQDHGLGIAPEDQARIFERFERAVPARHYGGLGLGLWITRRIVEALGGTVTVQSRPGEGSTFTVELPMVTPTAVPPG